jgi:hypothetical protein
MSEFDPMQVERYLDHPRSSTLTPVDDYRGEPSYVAASDYDALLALYLKEVEAHRTLERLYMKQSEGVRP